jgi:Tfp pilus assembly protein PilO
MLPPETTWSQYPIIAIIFLASAVIALAFYRLWKELLAWFEAQDVKREAERKAQRDWQAKQDEIRDLRWQEFLKSMQDEWIEQDGRHTEVLKQLSAKVDLLIMAMNNHDTWARAKDRV